MRKNLVQSSYSLRERKSKHKDTLPYTQQVLNTWDAPVLPEDIWVNVLYFLSIKDARNLMLINRNFYEFMQKDDRFWRYHCVSIISSDITLPRDASRALILQKRYLDTQKCSCWRGVIKYVVENCCRECGADPATADKVSKIAPLLPGIILCKYCRNNIPKYQLITKTNAKKMYSLTDDDLWNLEDKGRVIIRKNFHYGARTAMHLFLLTDIVRLCQKVEQEKKIKAYNEEYADRKKKLRDAMIRYMKAEKDKELLTQIDQKLKEIEEAKSGILYDFISRTPGKRLKPLNMLVQAYYSESKIEPDRKRKRDENPSSDRKRKKNNKSDEDDE
jgi:hypothetical protein